MPKASLFVLKTNILVRFLRCFEVKRSHFNAQTDYVGVFLHIFIFTTKNAKSHEGRFKNRLRVSS